MRDRLEEPLGGSIVASLSEHAMLRGSCADAVQLDNGVSLELPVHRLLPSKPPREISRLEGSSKGFLEMKQEEQWDYTS